jgi:hypothetical protein
MELIQIEEPGSHDEALADDGIALGLELTASGLRLAASVGGNAELIGSADGGADLLPALAGYDQAGLLTAGRSGLADQTAIGWPVMADPSAADARGAGAMERVAALIAAARYLLLRRLGRPIGGVVAIVPVDAVAGERLALMQAVEAGGMPVRRLIETPLALAWGLRLADRGDGAYLAVSRVAAGLALARVEIEHGVPRLTGGAVARDLAELRALCAQEHRITAILTSGSPEALALAGAVGLPSLGGGDDALVAVRGAALCAEALA